MVDIQQAAVVIADAVEPPTSEDAAGDTWKPVEEEDDWSDFDDDVGDDYFDETGGSFLASNNA